MRFRFPVVENNQNDNLICMGQKIAVNIAGFTHIMFLGCAEFGNHLDYATVEYADGFQERVLIELTSWFNSTPDFNEAIARTGDYAVRTEHGIEKYPFPGHLFAKCYSLAHQGAITSIILPVYPNLHIFSISFGRAVN